MARLLLNPQQAHGLSPGSAAGGLPTRNEPSASSVRGNATEEEPSAWCLLPGQVGTVGRKVLEGRERRGGLCWETLAA